MRLLRIVPDDTKFDFMRFRRISFPMSALLSILAILLYFIHGLNFGIDFIGGTLIEVQTKAGPADLAKMRSTLGGLGLGDVQLQQFGAPERRADPRRASSRAATRRSRRRSHKVRGALGDEVDYRRVEVVGPRVSGELLSYGIIGLMLAILCILIYLWFRFEWQFALGAMIANVHDLVLTIGFMSVDADRLRPHQHRGAAHHPRLFAQRHGGHLRPHPRNAAALQAHADAGSAQRFGQPDAVALDHHPRHRVAGACWRCCCSAARRSTASPRP